MLNLFIIALVFSAYICYNVIVEIELGNSNAEKEGSNMPIKYKKDILAALKEKGYSSTRIRNEKIIGQSYLQQLRHGEMVSWKTIETICRLLNCQPGDLLEYVEVEDKKLQEESPKPIKNANTETESFEEQLKRIILKRL